MAQVILRPRLRPIRRGTQPLPRGAYFIHPQAQRNARGSFSV
jgi:hypothetical protein